MARPDGTKVKKELVDFKDDASDEDETKINVYKHVTGKLDAIERENFIMSNPIPLTNFFVNKPCICLLILFVVTGILSGIVFYNNWFKAAAIQNRDYLIWDDPKTIDYDKSEAARALLVAGVGGGEDELPLQSSVDLDWSMFLIYSRQANSTAQTIKVTIANVTESSEASGD